MIGVSVVIPARNESASIEALLSDLLAQERAPDEIVVVDAGSTDDTAERVRAVGQRDARVRVVAAGPAFPGKARNVGAAAATMPWIAFVDAGMRVDKGWLRTLLAPVDAGAAVDIVLGSYDVPTRSRQERATAMAFVPEFRPTPEGGRWRGITIASAALRTDLVRAHPFPEDLRSAEDLIFLTNVQRAARVTYVPAAKVVWQHPPHARALWRRFRSYAEHSFRAGQMGDWFGVVSKRYLALGLLSGPALPMTLPLFLLARAAVARRRKPELVEPGGALHRALQVAEVAGYVAIIDAATWVAWLHWRRAGSPRRSPG